MARGRCKTGRCRNCAVAAASAASVASASSAAAVLKMRDDRATAVLLLMSARSISSRERASSIIWLLLVSIQIEFPANQPTISSDVFWNESIKPAQGGGEEGLAAGRRCSQRLASP